MIILDNNGKEKTAVSLRIITHEIRDAVNKGAIPEKFIEAVIKGKHRPDTWVEWYPLSKFRENNPNIEV